jgi:hypothetical protein
MAKARTSSARPRSTTRLKRRLRRALYRKRESPLTILLTAMQILESRVRLAARDRRSPQSPDGAPGASSP